MRTLLFVAVATAAVTMSASVASAAPTTVLNTELGLVMGGVTTSDSTGTRSTNPSGSLASETFAFDE